mmetsp:Transcript_17934/g.27744  ORF Transcript_17934/g.27744 Transcript_17934/m.27744 type:complete len:186 (-) Transcript_17934:122-679(-)
MSTKHILLLEDDFFSCQSLSRSILESSMALQNPHVAGVWLSEGGNGFFLRAADWQSLSDFLLDNVGGVSAMVDGVCKSTEPKFGGVASCLQPLAVDWLIQDFLLGNRQCVCCCAEAYRSFPAVHPMDRRARRRLWAVRPSPLVHEGRVSTLNHKDSRLGDSSPVDASSHASGVCKNTSRPKLILL